jgi:hypothetical protein
MGTDLLSQSSIDKITQIVVKVSQSDTSRTNENVDSFEVGRKLRNVMFSAQGQKWIPDRDYDEKNL